MLFGPNDSGKSNILDAVQAAFTNTPSRRADAFRDPDPDLPNLVAEVELDAVGHFRRAFGTSPGRYRTMRRLTPARRAIESGQPLARVAARTGFADQSHVTRQFKRTYGPTPARWAAATAPDRSAAS